MADTEKKVLLDVQVKATDALKNLSQLKIQIDDLKNDQKAIQQAMNDTNASTKEGAENYEMLRVEYEKAGQEIKALTARSLEYQKEIQNNIKHENEQQGSLQKLKAELSLNTAAYNKLSEAERNSVKGSMLQNQIVETTNKLKEAEAELGNFRRNVGDYSIAGKALKDELKELTNQMIVLAEQGDTNSAEFQSVSKRAGELKDAMLDVRAEIKAQASDTGVFDGLSQSANLAISTYSVYKAAAQAVGFENEALETTMQKLSLAYMAINALQQIQSGLQKQSAAVMLLKNTLTSLGTKVQLLNAAATNAQNTAENGGIIAKTKAIVVTKLATAAQWLWNVAIAANPVMLLVIAIIAAIAAIVLLVSWLNSSSKAEKNAEKASADYEKQAQKTADTIDRINRRQTDALNARKNQMREEILQMQAGGATAEQVAKAKAKAEEDLRNIEIKASKQRVAEQAKELRSLINNINAQIALRDENDKGSKKYKEQQKAIDDLIKSRNDLVGKIKDEKQAQTDLTLQNAEADASAAAERRKKYQDNAEKLLDAQKKFQDEQNKLADIWRKNDFNENLKFNAQRFAENQKYEQDKLNMQKKFGKITASEYNQRNELLKQQEEAFRQEQIKQQQEYLIALSRQLKDVLGQGVATQIDEINEKYKKLAKDIENMRINPPKQGAGQSSENFKKQYDEYRDTMLRLAIYENDLEKQKQKEIKAVRENSLASSVSEMEKMLNDQYAVDLIKFNDNEAEKTRIQKRMNEQRSADVMAAIDKEQALALDALNKLGQETADIGGIGLTEEQLAERNRILEFYDKKRNEQKQKDNQAAREVELKQAQLHLNSELLAAGENAKARHDAKRAYLEKELELYKDNAEKQKEINAELVENDKELLEERIANFEEWSGKTMELFSAVSGLMKAQEDAELQEYEIKNNAKKESLKKRLDSGAISQKEYDKQVAQMDKEMEKKKSDLAIKQAKREKAIGIMQAIVNTALAVTSALTTQPFLPMGPIMAAIAGALGAIQIATIASQPLPKASRGVLLYGASHADGGIPIEAEGGEAIINKRSTSMFRPLLSAINEVGGGVKFADGGVVGTSITQAINTGTARFANDGGYAARQNEKTATADDIANAVSSAVSQLRVITTVEDYRREEANYVEVANFGTI